jgi:hypothetical protein
VLRRTVADVKTPVPVYEVDREGESRRIAWLHPVAASRFHVESCSEDVDSATYDDWPWWLHQLRPAGFLGRHIAGLYPTLGLPEEPSHWSGDQLLRYLNHYSSNSSGALIIGEPALTRWLRSVEASTPEDVSPENQYPILVNDVLAGAPPASSAEGEQPKFLVSRTASRPERLVKFSPLIRDAAGRRVADLLIAEHHALRTLTARGISAASSTILQAEGRVFLESVRFDRTRRGRLGLLSLEPIDLEFVGDGGRNRWPRIVRRLIELERVPKSVLLTVQRLHAFGVLIGNNDMHTGNLSFMVRGHRVLSLAPAYDMVPMAFSPIRGEVPEQELNLTLSPDVPRSVWEWAILAAESFWFDVAADVRISDGFRRLSEQCISRLRSAMNGLRRLPE